MRVAMGVELVDNSKQHLGFNFEEFVFRYRWPIGLSLLGVILVGLGVVFSKGALNTQSAKIEVLESTTEAQNTNLDLVVEVSGAVERPGIYKFSQGSRIGDAIIAAGGVSEDADRIWMEKSLNRALKLSDGQKIYIPVIGESNTSNNSKTGNITGGGGGEAALININVANQSQLEELPGIGPVYAQNIIEQRPYSTVEELLNRKILKKNVYEKIKDKVTAY